MTFDRKKKFDYIVDKNIQHKLPADIVKTLRENAFKYVPKKVKGK
jgi:hypothetical protein